MIEYRARRGAALDWTEPVRPPLMPGSAEPDGRFEVRSRRHGRVIVHTSHRFSLAGGIPVLSAATVTSITTTTVRPRVTVTF
jgi:hypothetical protein